MTSHVAAGKQRFSVSALGLYRMHVANTAMRWSVMLIGIAISGVLVTVSTELHHWILGLVLLTATSMVVVRLDLFHPFTWFSPFFFLYSASVPILVWLEIKEDIGSLHETIFLEWIALAVFMLVVGPRQRSRASKENQRRCENHRMAAVDHLASCVRPLSLAYMAR